MMPEPFIFRAQAQQAVSFNIAVVLVNVYKSVVLLIMRHKPDFPVHAKQFYEMHKILFAVFDLNTASWFASCTKLNAIIVCVSMCAVPIKKATKK